MIIGALVGLVTAVANWDSKPMAAASSIVVSAAIGLGIGYYVSKRRRG
jgi:uncharacterized membrane protein